MKGLHISANSILPMEAVTQTFAILAKRGVGKTYTALVMVEEFLKANLHVVVADPVGVCWGLRAGADGKSPGLPIVVLGGEHGDLPLDVSAGTVIANLIVEEGLSVVLDLSLMRKSEQVRFMADFAERLYQRNRKPLHLVLDEADLFAPQRPMPGQQRMLGAVEDLVRRGRAKGLGITLVTQRSAVLNKDVLTQVEVLMALRTIAPQDRNAIDEWVKVHGTPEQRNELMKSLPSLPIGTAWFWSPGWLNEFKRVKVRKRETFDSSATPKIGTAVKAPKKLAKVDLERLQRRIAATIEKAKADDPRELRKRIAELEQLLGKQKTNTIVQRVEIPVLDEKLTKRLELSMNKLSEISTQLISAVREISSALSKLNSHSPLHVVAPPRGVTSNRLASRPNIRAKEAEFGGKLAGGERKILTALAQYPDGRAKNQVAILTGYSHRGGAFNNYLSSLRTKGLIEGAGDNLRITALGQLTGPYEPLPQGQALIDYWLSQLGKAERSILITLIDIYPDAISKDEIAIRTGYKANGGGFNNAISRLRTLDLIHGRGELRVTDDFFTN